MPDPTTNGTATAAATGEQFNEAELREAMSPELAGTLAALGQPAPAIPKYTLDSDLLTPRDLMRAKVALADVLKGRDPSELLDARHDSGEQSALLMWCFLSRDDPSITWDQAADTPFKAFRPRLAEPPPRIAGPTPTGSEPGSASSKRASRSPRSATSTASA